MEDKCIYTNGDSFVAGTELADELLPGYPGANNYPWGSDKHEKDKQWYFDTFKENTESLQIRLDKGQEILRLEYERAFPAKMKQKLGIEVINHAVAGSSMDRIARTAIYDLLKLKKQYKNIIAIIGTTHCARFEVASCEKMYFNPLGQHTAWTSLSTNYKLPFSNQLFDDMITYQYKYSDTYHFVMNYLKNAILIKYFCKAHNIKLYWVTTNNKIEDDIAIMDEEYRDLDDVKQMYIDANIKPIIRMHDIAATLKTGVLCPSGHYSEKVHEYIANELITKLKDHL